MAPADRIRKALITGISGSGGSYLAEHIAADHPGVEIHGMARWHSTATADNLAAVRERLSLHECDLTDLSAVFTVLKSVRPDAIFHLASHANVRASFVNPLAVMQNNVMGTANLLEGVRMAGIDPVVQICSTSEVYGQVLPRETPVTEDQPLRACSPYGVSKVAQDLLGLAYFRSYGMKVVRTRMFAYINPRRADLFATSFARQVVRVERGLQKEVLHGNLDSVRTLIDVRDAMESYWLAALRCEAGEAYNIGGTTTISCGQFLDLLKKQAKAPIPSRVDERLLRPSDVTLQIPDTRKFSQATGWEPKRSFAESVAFLLDYWRERER
ncbi:MAG: GDP-mannose 4,6-dehydratase [Elusimicrobia bacterium]|nr:GDP-mannose 4,6-dehydratase [Elusimicrobiota bacterium]